MYIFVGLLYSEVRRQQIIKEVKTALESAANTYQWGLLHGLQNVTDEQIEIINSVPMGSFPKQSKILKEKATVEEENGFTIDNIGYWNFPIIKQYQRSRGLYKRICKIVKNTNQPVTVVLYSLYYPYLKALDKLKKKYSHFQYIVIVPDLPCEYGIESPNKIKRWINRKLGYKSLAFAEKADGYIFLTEYMSDVINKKNRPYEIIEGIGRAGKISTVEFESGEKPIILYTGTLDKVFGIRTLLEAYLCLPENSAELWIAGAGDAQDELKEISARNKNIKFFGYCTKEKVFEMQNKASILVNPRPGKDEYTKYSFPSKTMEYLSTGKPVAMNRLPGIPKEYEEHVFFFKEETPASMAETFNLIFNLSSMELAERKEKQQDFIQNQKCSNVQAQKIVKLKNEYFSKDIQ